MVKDQVSTPVSYLRNEYQRHQALFNAQPAIIQHFLQVQAQHLADAVINDALQVRFSLPDRIVDKTPQISEMAAMLVPEEIREQTVGGWLKRFQNIDLHEELRQRLNLLEQSSDQAISSSASLLRFATSVYMVHNMLPAGRSVTYRLEGEEQIPSIPVITDGETDSAITSTTDAIVEQDSVEAGRGELQVPFVPAARRFYLPQWVAFDENGTLLANSVADAEAQLTSMQRYIKILHAASSLATYMLADEEYQRKRYGMLGQVINQGRTLAKYKTNQIIRDIQDRVEKGMLNRGLSISLPYFDDQELRLQDIELEVIPAGRIMFKAVFVQRATQLEYAKVSQDTRLSASTRQHLLSELDLLAQAFNNFHEQVVR